MALILMGRKDRSNSLDSASPPPLHRLNSLGQITQTYQRSKDHNDNGESNDESKHTKAKRSSSKLRFSNEHPRRPSFSLPMALDPLNLDSPSAFQDSPFSPPPPVTPSLTITPSSYLTEAGFQHKGKADGHESRKKSFSTSLSVPLSSSSLTSSLEHPSSLSDAGKGWMMLGRMAIETRHPLVGIHVQERKIRFKTHKNCFSCK